MNAGAPERVTSTSEFLETVRNFNKKCSSGNALTPKEIKEFHEIISKTATIAQRRTKPSAATEHPNKEILKALETLKKTLGQNKAAIESAASGVPLFRAIDTAFDQVAKYVREEEEEARKVGRKPDISSPY